MPATKTPIAATAETVAQATESAAQTAAEVAATAQRVQQEAQAKARAETLPPRVAVARGRGALLAALAGLIGFVGIFGIVRAKRSEAFDAALMMKWQAARHPMLAAAMRVVSWPGFPPQSRLMPPVVMASLWFLRFRLEAVFQLLAWGTGGLSTVLKGLMKRPRPVAGTDLRVVVAPLGGSSFPSGHVITYAGTYGWMAYLAHTLIRPRTPRRVLVSALLGLVALVGPSRIYQGHHWPTDVAASYLLGLSYFIGLSSIYRRLKGRRVLA